MGVNSNSLDTILRTLILGAVLSLWHDCHAGTWTRLRGTNCAQTFTLAHIHGFQVYEYEPRASKLVLRAEMSGPRVSSAYYSCALQAVVVGYSDRGLLMGDAGIEIIGDARRRTIPLRDGVNALIVVGDHVFVTGALLQHAPHDVGDLVEPFGRERAATARTLADPTKYFSALLEIDAKSGTVVRRVVLPQFDAFWRHPDGTSLTMELAAGEILRYSLASGRFSMMMDGNMLEAFCPYADQFEVVGETYAHVYGDLSPIATAQDFERAACVPRSIYVHDLERRENVLGFRFPFRPELAVNDARRIVVFGERHVAIYDVERRAGALRRDIVEPGRRAIASAPIAAGYAVVWHVAPGSRRHSQGYELVLYNTDFSRVLARRALPEVGAASLTSERIPQQKQNYLPLDSNTGS